MDIPENMLKSSVINLCIMDGVRALVSLAGEVLFIRRDDRFKSFTMEHVFEFFEMKVYYISDLQMSF